VNVLSAGEVQVDPAVVKELREAYENDPFYSIMYEDPGEQFTKNDDGLLYDAERRLCVPVGSVGQLIKIAMLRVKNALPFLEC
jgi:hypothetical protein